jgi:putative phage-type endonuclease
MSMTTHNLIQGSPEWHAYRAQHFNASDAPAMMGCSPYMTRTELLTRMKTGITADVDASTQRRFDDGHRFEALARPLAEKIIGEDLYAVTGSRGKLSASFDGLTIMEDTGFEHKSLNDELRHAIPEGDLGIGDSEVGGSLPLHYRVQMEQQLLVAEAERVLFMASKWSGDTLVEERHCWYESDPALRAQIVAGWHQFETDLANFVPTVAEVKTTGKAPEALPALHIVINGGVSASNLDEFKETALGAIRSVNRELTTDVHFADAEKAVKWCSDIEDRIKAAKDHALSQTASIDALFKTMDEISAEARRVRLDLDKLVKARKEAIKGEIVAGGVAALAKYIRELNASMPADYMPTVPADFGGCIKGLRTVESIRNAVDTELARAKIHASEIANLIRVNVGLIDAANAPNLFAFDIKGLVLKNSEDLANVIALRINTEEKRKEAERERIRAEEAARLEREAASKAAAEKAEADRVERERAHAVQAEADRKAREQQEAVSAQHIRDEQAPLTATARAAERVGALIAGSIKPLTIDEIKEAESDRGIQADDGARMTLGQINERLSPVSITVAGLSELGYEPVAVVKAARMYPASKFKAICQAISAHALAAATEVVTK